MGNKGNSTDVLYNEYKAKMPVSFKRASNGKKTDVRFPYKWKDITDNKCVGDEDNIAFKCGVENNLTVLDFDTTKAVQWFENNVYRFQHVQGHVVKTHNGYHLYYQYSQELEDVLAKHTSSKIGVVPGLDIRGKGNCIFYGKGYELKDYKQDVHPVPSEFLDAIEKHLSIKNKMKRKNSQPVVSSMDYKSDKKDLFKTLKNLDANRADNYQDWIRVAMALKNSFGDTYKNLFHSFSKRSDKYDEDTVNKYWDGLNEPEGRRLTIGTLYDMLKRDDLETFNQIMDNKKDIMKEQMNEKSYDEVYKYFQVITDLTEVETFLSRCIRTILNRGVTIYANKTKDGKWNVCKYFPLDNSKAFYVKEDEKLVKYTFYEAYTHIEGGVTRNDLIFEPCNPKIDYDFEANNNFNLFRGWNFKYDPNLTDYMCIDRILYHIKRVLADDDEECNEYILQWLAHIIQKPTKKTGICPVFVSDRHGAGKNTFWDWFGRDIIGDGYQATNIDSLFGRFTKRYEMTQLAVLDEAQTNGLAYKLNNQLKNLISQGEQTIEPKGLEAYTMKDYRNYVILSNNEHIVKIEATDRRFVMLKCYDGLAKNKDHFNPLLQDMDDPIVRKTFFHYLVNYDISRFNLEKNIPKTDLKERMMKLSVPNHIRFLEYCYDHVTCDWWPSGKLYDIYKEYIKEDEGNHGLMTQTKFGMELKKHLESKRSAGTKFYISKDSILSSLRKYYQDPDYMI